MKQANREDDPIDIDAGALGESLGLARTADIDPALELRRFEVAVELQEKLVRASIKATKPQDWVFMGGKAYLQGTGSERVMALWGIVLGEPTIDRFEEPDANFGFTVTGPAGSRRTGVFFKRIVGGRSSSDPFFDKFDEDKPKEWEGMSATEKRDWKMAHRIPPDVLDVKKAAVTNWQTRCVSMLSGLRGLTKADVESMGIRGAREVEFGTGGKGGNAAPADLKAEQTKLGNEILKRVGGDKDAARSLCKDITSNPEKNFGGFDRVDAMKQGWQLEAAWKKLRAHSVFGDNAKHDEPGSDG